MVRNVSLRFWNPWRRRRWVMFGRCRFILWTFWISFLCFWLWLLFNLSLVNECGFMHVL